MKKLLIALYPRRWRERYGDELEAMLDQAALSPGVVLDVLKGSLIASWRETLRTPWQVAVLTLVATIVAQELAMVLVAVGSGIWGGHYPNLRVQVGPLLFWDWASGESPGTYSIGAGIGGFLLIMVATIGATLASWRHRHQVAHQN